ncbi:MAG: caspase family protein [Saprospiraceae bacterium]|nr:caspase family protein [Saprospiraceae bacterium]
MKTLLSVMVAYVVTCTTLTAQCMDGDCQNGRGTYQFENGNKYQGDFRKGLMHGKGAIIFGNGNRYNGDWSGGMREGLGIYTFVDGKVYTGSFRKNKFDGNGTMNFPSGNKYAGKWENDQPNGQGIYYFASGDRYEGAFVNGKFTGSGTMYYKNNERYVGEWRDNQRHGRGKMYRSNGAVIEGSWVDGQFQVQNNTNTVQGTPSGEGAKINDAVADANEKLQDCNKMYCRNGKGIYQYGDGSKWIGEFKDGVPEGKGTCYYVNGDKYVGKFERHAPNGEGTMYHANGRIVTAVWEYGRPIGDVPSNSQATTTQVDVERSSEVKIWAVVVGVGRYTTMPVLKYSDDDAYQFYAFLKSPEGGALPDKQVKVLVDEDATRVNILQTMRQVLLKADENDVIVFYFSGHGLEGSFLPQDFDGINNRLLHAEVKSIFEQSKAKHKLCIADACFSGSLLALKQPLAPQLQAFYKAFDNTQGGMALFMSSKSQEYSLEDQGLRSGIFSHYLIRGLKGEADMDGNKIVTVREIYDFVFKSVRSYTSSAQTPTINGQFDWSMPVSMVRQ